MRPGDKILASQLSGEFTLPKDVREKLVFIAGGIGITPFRSMLQQATRTSSGHRLFLLYSNRHPEDAAFLAELQELAKLNSNFTLAATMTDLERSKVPWAGAKGFINKEMLVNVVGDLAGPIYYTAGPPAMVAAMRQTLSEAGVDEDDIRSEDFSGY